MKTERSHSTLHPWLSFFLRSFTAAVTAAYGLLVGYWMFVGFGRSGQSHDGTLRYNLKPLATIKRYFIHHDHFNMELLLINIGGNIAVFIPFGFAIPIIFKWGYWRTILFFIIGITLVELLQMGSGRGSFDIDDVILNTVGASIGCWVYRTVKGMFA
ncbi:VanZ family protein [Paenibacillus sp. GCM10023252]|uniref:VanZ family protein n=1 Tax=Paenibacillus sp. GCM10023252 TaxID=3252649 RepID=UPI00361D51A5